MARKAIEAFEIVDHGIEHEQYFQGCGTAFTSFDEVATGCGWNPAEAIDDALEQLACTDWDTEGMDDRIKEEWPRFDAADKTNYLENCVEDCHYYISIRVR